MKMAAKTNAVRIVTAAGYSCTEGFYEFDENDLNGNHAAQALGLPPEQVFKTLVTRGPHTGINVFCIPVCCELDLKKAAKAAGDKSVVMIAVKELLGITGYIRGGCSPIGMKKKYPTFIDEFNNLLIPEEQIIIKEPGHLTTELRIYAFLRMGVEDSTKIASFLNYSVNTIYTYRNKIKSKAKDRETFETSVMKIGSFS